MDDSAAESAERRTSGSQLQSGVSLGPCRRLMCWLQVREEATGRLTERDKSREVEVEVKVKVEVEEPCSSSCSPRWPASVAEVKLTCSTFAFLCNNKLTKHVVVALEAFPSFSRLSLRSSQ